jgi:hypothetical protein
LVKLRNFSVSGLFLLTPLFYPLVPAPAQSPEPTPWPVSKNILAPILQTDHATYVVGQPVLVRASMKNTTGTDYFVRFEPVARVVLLTVRDASGNLIQPTGLPLLLRGEARTPYAIPLYAGQTKPIPSRGQEWINLSDWGYAPLGPGVYTITMLLHTGGRAFHVVEKEGEPVNGPGFVTSDDPGNGPTASVRISIEP